jgi:hypothetical protein
VSNTIKYLLWFALGLTLATGTVVSQNLTLSEQLLTNMFAAQTNKSQITQVADGAGNIIASTSNNLNVQCANCSGSGASAADAATFTAGSSTFAPAGGEFTSGGATACVTAHQCMVAMTAGRGFFSDINTWAETSLGVPTAYGVAPTTGNYIGVNAFVTNASPGIANNADGVTAVGASATSPVPVDNYNYVFNGSTWDRAPGSTTGAQIKVASGGIVSGAFASGAFAAGSFVNATAGDPCMFQLKTNVPISTASGTVALVTGVSAKKI